jgi:L-2-hydroxyglutarate oxidase LhgO
MMAEGFDFDVTVIGAGAVGLACGRAFAQRGCSVLVVEQASHIGQGVSSRNSEVIHAGLYYPTGSLKAQFCVDGRRALYEYLETRKISFRRCGKLVVATSEDEVARIESIFGQALANGVEGMSHLTGAQARALEPGLNAFAAILSPESGVFASHDYMLALQGEIEDSGGSVVLSTTFTRADRLAGGGFRIATQSADAAHGGAEGETVVTSHLLVTAAGLQAQDVARRIMDYPVAAIPTRYLGKGIYFRLTGKAPFERLIYPPPIPGALGTHYRKDLGGQAIFGPDLSFVDDEDYSVDPAKAAIFADYIRRFWPGLPEGALVPDYAGIRPKLHGQGQQQPDFQLHGESHHGMEGLIALFGIESPGLTSSLAIGEAVAQRLFLTV